jgi:hypothetical protein
VFERQWAQTILEQAVKRLREEYLAQGQGALFDLMKDFQPGKHGTLSYVEVGAQLGMTESAVKSRAPLAPAPPRDFARGNCPYGFGLGGNR